ncbi:MAG: tRNA pseudouridine(13) synthase TruD [Thermoplasmata archaeon]|nr:tRNA pseudouridine(13) synthase TruD [Thermoplasmata archaeon]
MAKEMMRRPVVAPVSTRWEPAASERALGLGFYVTHGPGFVGRLKTRPEDFRVDEISANPRPAEGGAYTVMRVVSRNWEQHELSQRLASVLGLPPHAMSWAGTKDRRAIAERLVSYRGPLPAHPIDLPDVEILEAYTARDGLTLGHHFGNTFSIRIGVEPMGLEASERAARAIREELVRLGGFANLFGPQRFGEVRPVTHDVGRHLVHHDVAGAVHTYLCAIPDATDTVGVEARRAYADHGDANRALREFPPYFRFERQMLDHLARGQTPERALRALSRELRLLFVHAYQSLLFNRWLTGRVAVGLPLHDVVAGDFVLRVGRDGTVPGTEAVPVTGSNLEECRDTVGRGRARLAGPLVGFDTPRPVGVPGELLERLLAEEKISRSDFELPGTPELASAGVWRPVWVNLPPIGVVVEPQRPGATEPDPGLWLNFGLPKGCYATVLLREFLKTGATLADNGGEAASSTAY